MNHVKIIKGQAIGKNGEVVLKSGKRISKRELEVFIQYLKGLNYKKVGKKLFISESTVGNHISNMMEKLGAKNRADAILIAIQNEIISIKPERSLVAWKGNEYALCMMCGRASPMKEFREEEPQLDPSNPEMPSCPYDDCKEGNIGNSLRWEIVRYFCPEYDEVPVHGKVYEWKLEWMPFAWLDVKTLSKTGENKKICGVLD